MNVQKLWRKALNYYFKNRLLLWLILLSLVILTFKINKVALLGDEAIYSQTARETLENKSFFTLYFNNNVWFEKPPLLIWITMGFYWIFGISQNITHLIPILFSVLCILYTYKLAYLFFNSKLAAFLSGFFLLSNYAYLWYSRQNMMDIPLMFFISFSFYYYFKYFKKKEKKKINLNLSALGIGLAILIKSVVGFIPFLIILIHLCIFNRKLIFSKRFIIFIVIIILIFLPWHIIMFILYGWDFWNSYFGYHISHRALEGMHTDSANINNYFFYISRLFKKISIYEIIFIFTLLFRKFYNFKKYKREIIFLFIWFFTFLILFSLIKTKLNHYILPIITPAAIYMGFVINNLYQKKSALILIVSVVSLLNLFEFFYLKDVYFGKTVIVVPFLLDYYFNISIIIKSFCILFWIIIFCLLKKYRTILVNKALIIIIIFNLIIPIKPVKNNTIKNGSDKINKVIQNNPVKLNVLYEHNYPSYSFLFYLPRESKHWYINRDEKMVYYDYKNKMEEIEFCFIEYVKIKKDSGEKVDCYKKGCIFPCKIMKKNNGEQFPDF